MQQLGAWVVRLTAAAMVCGILCALAGEGTRRELLRTVCGVVLAVTALQPLTKVSLPDFQAVTREYLDQGREAAALGEDWAEEERRSCIKLGLETYILDKAALLGAQVEVSVRLDGEGLPVSAEIRGDISASDRRALEDVMADTLGIPREDQIWIGRTGKTP